MVGDKAATKLKNSRPKLRMLPRADEAPKLPRERTISLPQFRGGEPRAVNQAAEFGPHDLRFDLGRHAGMERRGKAAIGARDHVLASDQLRQANDALGDQFGMFDDDGRVSDTAWDQHFSLRKLHILPHAPLVLMTGIRHLEGVRAGADGHDQVGKMLHLHVARPRSDIDAIAGMMANPLWRDVAERVV